MDALEESLEDGQRSLCLVDLDGVSAFVLTGREGIEMLMSFPRRVEPVQNVQERMGEVIQHLSSLIGVDHHCRNLSPVGVSTIVVEACP